MNLTSLISKSAKSLAMLAMLAAMPMAAKSRSGSSGVWNKLRGKFHVGTPEDHGVGGID